MGASVGSSSGLVTGLTGGTATVTGQYSSYAYVWNQMMYYCSPHT